MTNNSVNVKVTLKKNETFHIDDSFMDFCENYIVGGNYAIIQCDMESVDKVFDYFGEVAESITILNQDDGFPMMVEVVK